MPLSTDTLNAVRRYGPSVDSVGRRYGISGTALLAKLIQGESGDSGSAVSNVGARGWAQFMPGTRKAVLDRTGGKVDPWRSPGEAVQAAVMHLRGELGHRVGLEGYNPGGGRGYVDYILGQRVGNVSKGVTGGGGQGGGMLVGMLPGVAAVPGQPAPPDTGGGALALLLARQAEGQAPRPVSGVPEAPEHSSRKYLAMPDGARFVSSPAPAPPEDTLGGLLEAIRGEGPEMPVGQAGVPGAPGMLIGMPQSGQAGGGRVGGGSGRKGLIRSARNLDALAGEFGVPVTAKQEPGHATGGDHDPAVRGATARDFGGSEEQRKALFLHIARGLGVKNPVYKGPDINVTRNGIRWQVISRDHGTGPHLHVGMRLVG